MTKNQPLKHSYSRKNISILIPDGDISISNVEGLHHIFAEVNKFMVRNGNEPMFYFQLVGKRKEHFLKEDYFSIHPRFLLEENVKTDLLIIPALHGDILKSLELNRDLIPWIREQYAKGTEVMSLCTGAFLLASTGLLAGKSCTTHWIHAAEFRNMFNDVSLMDDHILTEEQGIYTSGAAYSYLNLILYYIEKYTSREVVLFIAKVFAIDMSRNGQSHFSIFQGYKFHEDKPILKAQEYIETHYQDRFKLEEIASHVALGRRNFERRFKAATSNSVLEYIHRVKVEAAKKQLESGDKTVSEICLNIGYNDVKSFREVFKKIVGMSPIEYRGKFSTEGIKRSALAPVNS